MGHSSNHIEDAKRLNRPARPPGIRGGGHPDGPVFVSNGARKRCQNGARTVFRTIFAPYPQSGTWTRFGTVSERFWGGAQNLKGWPTGPNQAHIEIEERETSRRKERESADQGQNFRCIAFCRQTQKMLLSALLLDVNTTAAGQRTRNSYHKCLAWSVLCLKVAEIVTQCTRAVHLPESLRPSKRRGAGTSRSNTEWCLVHLSWSLSVTSVTATRCPPPTTSNQSHRSTHVLQTP